MEQLLCAAVIFLHAHTSVRSSFCLLFLTFICYMVIHSIALQHCYMPEPTQPSMQEHCCLDADFRRSHISHCCHVSRCCQYVTLWPIKGPFHIWTHIQHTHTGHTPGARPQTVRFFCKKAAAGCPAALGDCDATEVKLPFCWL